MPGGNAGLRCEFKLLKLLSSEGPAGKTAMKRALGWELFVPNKNLDPILSRMREAGLIEPYDRKDGGRWIIAHNKEICGFCQGRGVLSKDGKDES